MHLRDVGRAAHLPFAVFVLCLGIVVAGLDDTFLGDLVGRAGARTVTDSAPCW